MQPFGKNSKAKKGKIMTDTNVDTGSPAAGADTGSPNGGGNPQGQQPTGQQSQGDQGQPQGQQQQGNDAPAFALPEAYKDKPWASKIKSQEDLFKQIDNLDQLAGKKAITPIDYTKATPEEIKAYHSKLAPADISAYKFSQPDDPTSQAVGAAFREAGINEHQGQAVIKALAPFFEKMDADVKSNATSEEGYMKLSKEAFGDNFKDTIGKVEKVLKEYAPDDATKKALDDMPNDQRIAVDKTVNKLVEGYEARIAKILKDHGIQESGAQGEGGQGKTGTDKASIQKDLRAQIRALDARPHTAQEKQALIDRLNDTYKS